MNEAVTCMPPETRSLGASPYTQSLNYFNTRPTLIATYHMAGIFAEAVVVV